jgi:hypothetical protein
LAAGVAEKSVATVDHYHLYLDATGLGEPVVAVFDSRVQSLLQAGRVHLPRTREAQVLTRELHDYEIRVDENAHDRYGAFRVGTHDDLVTALGLAVQVDDFSLGGALPAIPGW